MNPIITLSLKEDEALQCEIFNTEIYVEVLRLACDLAIELGIFDVKRTTNIAEDQISNIFTTPCMGSSNNNLLNDLITDSLVRLSDKYSFEELLKYPVIFMSLNGR